MPGTFIAIDLKSFYASVECIERGLDPLTTNLVVADASRTDKTICLAVSPSLKAHGISGRARLFEVNERVRQVNIERLLAAPGHRFTGRSASAPELKARPDLALDFHIATPRMAYYLEYSTRIYEVYLKYFSPEDIHVYSIDEVLIDVTPYLSIYKKTPRELAMAVIRDILKESGITATAGIGTNLYLCKIAMDIVAKHVEPDEQGVRIAELDEMSYRHLLWTHRPIRDFWRVGRGIARKLEENGLFTMGDVARFSLTNEDRLYDLFGVNAELLIDHAWGREPCTMAQVKAYKPESNSFSAGQVLQEPYPFDKARIVVHEMTEAVALDLIDKNLVTDQMVLTVGYDITSLTDPAIRKQYKGPVTTDWYGRPVPKSAHGTANLSRPTSSAKQISGAVLELYDKLVNPILPVRRITVETNHVIPGDQVPDQKETFEQLDLFTDYAAVEREREAEAAELDKERRAQEAMLAIKKKYGKNAMLKGLNFEEGATGRDRNAQIGGHKA